MASEVPVTVAALTTSGMSIHAARSSAGEMVLAGYGFRTDRRAHDEISAALGLPVVSLELVDPHSDNREAANWADSALRQAGQRGPAGPSLQPSLPNKPNVRQESLERRMFMDTS